MGAIVASYYLFIGQLVDPKNQKNLTEERLIEFNKIDVKQLPLEQAIRYVKGDGKRTLYIYLQILTALIVRNWNSI